MIGVLVNCGAVILGGLAGVLLKKGIPEKVVNAIMQAVGLCVVYVAVDGFSSGGSFLVTIFSLALGTAVGTLIDIDHGVEVLGQKVEYLVSKSGKKASVAQGFTTASLLFCIGAMAITGSINAGLTGDNSILYTKSLLDCISSVMLAATLGIGVSLSAVSILVYQGAIALLAGVLSPVLSAYSGDIICTGSIMILAIGLNLVGITKIKVANMLPGIVVVPIAAWLFSLAGI